MNNLLIVSSSEKGRNYILELLELIDFLHITLCQNGSEARRHMIENEYDMIIIDAPLSDEMGDELSISITDTSSSGVMLIVEGRIYHDIRFRTEQHGVLTMSKPLNKDFFYQTYNLLQLSRKRILALQSKKENLQAKIAEIRLIDRAKCILIKKFKMTEEQAHKCIEKKSMDMRINRKQIAEIILKNHET